MASIRERIIARWRRKAGAAAAALLVAVAGWAGIGLSTNFTGVSFPDLEPGRVYDLAALAGRPLEVRNGGDAAVTIRIEPQTALPEMLLAGHEPLPEAGWISVSPGQAVLQAGETRRASVYLAVPRDERLRGRKLQGALWIRTVGDGVLQTAVRTRIPLTVRAMGGEEDAPDSAIFAWERPAYGAEEDVVKARLTAVRSGRVRFRLRADGALPVPPEGAFVAPASWGEVSPAHADIRAGGGATVSVHLHSPPSGWPSVAALAWRLEAVDAAGGVSGSWIVLRQGTKE